MKKFLNFDWLRAILRKHSAEKRKYNANFLEHKAFWLADKQW
jgi:hypothetical protein